MKYSIMQFKNLLWLLRTFIIEHVFLYDKEKLSLFKSFGALNKASYQDGGYWKQILKFLHFLRPFSSQIYTQLW